MNTWAAAIHVLSSPLLLRKTRKYVNVEQREINVSQMLKDAEATWSSGEIVMAKVAADFYNGGGHVELDDIMRVLDYYNLRVVLDAIEIYRNGSSVQRTPAYGMERWTWSIDDDLWDNEDFDTKIEAITYGRGMAEEYDAPYFFVAKLIPAKLKVGAQSVLDDLVDQAFEQVGEEARYWLHNLTPTQVEELETDLTTTFMKWAQRHNHTPNLYTVLQIEEIKV